MDIFAVAVLVFLVTDPFGNTAIYLARCGAAAGVQVRYVTALGDDRFSAGMLQRWQAALPFNPQQPVGGAIIDAEGREIPITEQMILQACRELEQSLQQRQAG